MDAWCSRLDPELCVAQVSVPGTHNSAACYSALPSVRCQNESIPQQLRHGVRFLDLRLCKNVLEKARARQNELVVCHGQFSVKLDGVVLFSAVLAQLYEFLAQHPKEFVIVSIKQEGPGDWNDPEFGSIIFNNYISVNRGSWYLGNEIPRVGQVQGKLLLFRRFALGPESATPAEMGFDASYWQYNCINDDHGTFQVQDFCEISSRDELHRKFAYIRQMLRVSNGSSQKHKLFLNFCSGSSASDPSFWPEKVAAALQAQHIHAGFGRRNGIVVLDFCDLDSWGLVRRLVAGQAAQLPGCAKLPKR